MKLNRSTITRHRYTPREIGTIEHDGRPWPVYDGHRVVWPAQSIASIADRLGERSAFVRYARIPPETDSTIGLCAYLTRAETVFNALARIMTEEHGLPTTVLPHTWGFARVPFVVKALDIDPVTLQHPTMLPRGHSLVFQTNVLPATTRETAAADKYDGCEKVLERVLADYRGSAISSNEPFAWTDAKPDQYTLTMDGYVQHDLEPILETPHRLRRQERRAVYETYYT